MASPVLGRPPGLGSTVKERPQEQRYRRSPFLRVMPPQAGHKGLLGFGDGMGKALGVVPC